MHRPIWRFVMSAMVCGLLLSSATSWAQGSRPLIDQNTARRYGLKRAWYKQIPLDRTRDRIASVTLDHGGLFVQTREGLLVALDAESGETLWSRQIGSGELLVSEIGASEKHVAVLSGSTIFLMARADGSVMWTREVRNAVGAGPAVSKNHVYVPMANGMFEGYQIDKPNKPPFIKSSSGRAMVQPFVTWGEIQETVCWPTDRGLFYVMGADSQRVRFRVEARDSVVAPPAYFAPYIYPGSIDGNLYRVHELSGQILWKFATGAPIVERPIATKDAVYVGAASSGVYAIDHKTGTEKWFGSGPQKILAVTPDRLYATNASGRMTIMRTDTGMRLAMLSTEHLDISVSNHETDRIYIGSSQGVIQCLHEIGRDEPVDHIAGMKKSDVKVVDQGGPDDGGDAGEPMDDPFGAGGDDLFGGDDDAGGGDAGADDDPFGG